MNAAVDRDIRDDRSPTPAPRRARAETVGLSSRDARLDVRPRAPTSAALCAAHEFDRGADDASRAGTGARATGRAPADRPAACGQPPAHGQAPDRARCARDRHARTGGRPRSSKSPSQTPVAHFAFVSTPGEGTARSLRGRPGSIIPHAESPSGGGRAGGAGGGPFPGAGEARATPATSLPGVAGEPPEVSRRCRYRDQI